MPRNDIQKQGRILMLPVDCIEPSPYQARTAFDEPEIAALAVSILQNGLLQPISVRRVGLHKYQLVAGERRLRACRLAKLDKVPAILADYDDSESAALGLLENLQRSQLDPFDTARGIKEVIRLWRCTQAALARHKLIFAQPHPPHADGLQQPVLHNADRQGGDLVFVKYGARLIRRCLDAIGRQQQHPPLFLQFFLCHFSASSQIKNAMPFFVKSIA